MSEIENCELECGAYGTYCKCRADAAQANDGLTEAQRESNINKAWQILNEYTLSHNAEAQRAGGEATRPLQRSVGQEG